MALRLSAPRVLLDTGFAGPTRVTLDGGRITDVQPVSPRAQAGPDAVLRDGFLTPGLIDLQVNGAFGVDVADAGPKDWSTLRTRLPATGVTAFVPTVITAPLPRLAATLRTVDAARRDHAAGARILGAHVEGPFLSPLRAGAHDAALFTDPTPRALDTLLAGPPPAIVTLAPERAHALAAVARLTTAGVVVGIGHTDATGDQVRFAVDAGARMVTHVFNAQRPLGHRELGTVGAALTDPRLTVGLIADLRHVAPEIVALVFRAAAGRVCLVTDAVAAMGTDAVAGPGDQRFALGGRPVAPDADGLPRRADGTIAGSVLRLDQAVRNAVACGVDLGEALRAATVAPADLLGRPDLGRLAVGAVADVLWWGDDLRLRQVWVGGEPLLPGLPWPG